MGNAGGESPRGKRACDWYRRNARLLGALYVIVPVLVWFLWALVSVPFRPVYALRVILTVLIGAPLGAYVHELGLSLWTIKHRSPKGPATLADGALIGAAVGFGCAFVGPLTALIMTNHPEQAKVFVIVSWAGAALLGGLIGLLLAAVGREHVRREWPADEGG